MTLGEYLKITTQKPLRVGVIIQVSVSAEKTFSHWKAKIK